MPTLQMIQSVTSMLPDANKNFQCDGFALDLQKALERSQIPYQGQVMVLRRTPPSMSDSEARKLNLAMGSDGTTYPAAAQGVVDKEHPHYVPSKRRVLPKIVLREETHALDNKVVGNESHFWTEIAMDDGQTYCFDNNHPNGVLQQEFYSSLDFVLERYRPDLGDGSRDTSAHTLFEDEAHSFKSRQELVEEGHVVIAPLSVEEQRQLANHQASEWKSLPNSQLPQAHSVTEQDLKPLKLQQDHADDISVELPTTAASTMSSPASDELEHAASETMASALSPR